MLAIDSKQALSHFPLSLSKYPKIWPSKYD